MDAPPLGDVATSDGQLIAHGEQIVARIGEIAGDLPVYLDIGSECAWASAFQATMVKLRALTEDGRFSFSGQDALGDLADWSRAARVLKAVSQNTRVIHGDLKADQVFVTSDGYRVIDWQRPCLAPPEIDLVSLLVDRKIDPRGVADRTAIDLFWFLRLHWAAEAQYTLFPEHRWGLFNRWASEAVEMILRA